MSPHVAVLPWGEWWAPGGRPPRLREPLIVLPDPVSCTRSALDVYTAGTDGAVGGKPGEPGARGWDHWKRDGDRRSQQGVAGWGETGSTRGAQARDRSLARALA